MSVHSADSLDHYNNRKEKASATGASHSAVLRNSRSSSLELICCIDRSADNSRFNSTQTLYHEQVTSIVCSSKSFLLVQRLASPRKYSILQKTKSPIGSTVHAQGGLRVKKGTQQ